MDAFEKYLDNIRDGEISCLICGERSGLNYFELEQTGDDTALQSVECSNCGASWSDEYKLTGVAYVELDTDMAKINADIKNAMACEDAEEPLPWTFYVVLEGGDDKVSAECMKYNLNADYDKLKTNRGWYVSKASPKPILKVGFLTYYRVRASIGKSTEPVDAEPHTEELITYARYRPSSVPGDLTFVNCYSNKKEAYEAVKGTMDIIIRNCDMYRA